MNKRSLLIMTAGLFLCGHWAQAQNDVMMQAFYWNVPVNETGKNGFWYDTLKAKIPAMKASGIRALWMPPPSKGNWGISDMGYGIFDHYDLGQYNQKGSTETRFGSKSELASLISTAHSTSNGAYMDLYADVILNHVYGNNTSAEESGDNPAVKTYEFNKAISGGTQRVPFPTNEIRWIIPNAAAGDYYIQITGFFLNYSGVVGERGYDVKIKFTDNAPPSQSGLVWEYEPNNGSGQFNVAQDQITYSGHMENSSDIDEYKVTLSTSHSIEITLVARREGTNSSGAWEWQWAAQTNAYYPSAIWYNGSNLATTSLKAYTATSIDYVSHTGTGEANFAWTYNNFHPVDANDYLGDGGSTEGGYEDQLVPNTKWFGNDLNTYDATVQSRLKSWGTWLTNTIGFDGYRLDFVRGFQEDMVSGWVKNLPLKSGGGQRFIVGEYFTSYKYRLKNWVNDIAAQGADVDVFDFPLKSTLTDLSNGSGSSFNMTWLNHAGMVRDNTGNSLSGTSVVTFLENHDTGKEHDKWVTKDWKLGYAYILFAEGRPCLFYPQYYGVKQVDNNNSSYWVQAPSSLKTDIDKMISLRSKYLGGSMIVLTEQGNPVTEPNPNGTTTFGGDTYNVYIARRQGNGTKNGAILVINNNDNLTRGIWVDNDGSPNGTATAGYADWKNQVLVNVLNPSQTVTVASDGRVHLYAPARGYSVWVLQSEYVAVNNMPAITQEFAAESNSFKVSPNPAQTQTNIDFSIAEKSHVTLEIFDASGRRVDVLANETMDKGKYTRQFKSTVKGVYTYRFIAGNYRKTGKLIME